MSDYFTEEPCLVCGAGVGEICRPNCNPVAYGVESGEEECKDDPGGGCRACTVQCRHTT